MKSFYRSKVREYLTANTADWREIGRRISDRIRELEEYRKARILCGFLPVRCEPVLTELYEEWLEDRDRRLYFPRFISESGKYEMANVTDISNQLVPGRYGILEPVPFLPSLTAAESEEAIWLVPGLSYSPVTGARLGRGGGFYDRLLDRKSGLKIGVASDCQLIDELPSESHDIRMNLIITESKTVRFPMEVIK